MTQVRDTLVTDKSHYENLIQRETDFAERISAKIDNGEVRPDAINTAYRRIMMQQLRKPLAHYSAGDDIETVKASLLDCFNYLEKSWAPENVKFFMGKPKVVYDKYWLDVRCEMQWMLSLGVLLHIEDAYFDRLIALLERDNVHETLFDYLIAARYPDRDISDEPTTTKPFGKLANMILDDINEAAMKKYVTSWYNSTKSLNWHGIHRGDHVVYFGYWNTEAAAVTAIARLDDSSYREHKYYPQDLVDYYREHLNK